MGGGQLIHIWRRVPSLTEQGCQLLARYSGQFGLKTLQLWKQSSAPFLNKAVIKALNYF